KVRVEKKKVIDEWGYPIYLAGFDAAGTKVFYGVGSILYAHDATTGKRLGQWPIRHGSNVPQNASTLASVLNVEKPGAWAMQVKALNAETAREKRTAGSGIIPGAVTPAALSGDGSRLLTFGRPSAGSDRIGPVQLWDLGNQAKDATPQMIKPLTTLQ